MGWSKGAPSTNASDMVSTDQVATVTVLTSEPTVTYYANFSGGSGSKFTVTEDGSISEHGTVTYKVNGTETAPVSGVINVKENDVITVTIDPDSLEFYDQKWALFNKTANTDVQEALKAAEADARANFGKKELIATAQEQADEVIRGFVQSVLPNGYELEMN